MGLTNVKSLLLLPFAAAAIFLGGACGGQGSDAPMTTASTSTATTATNGSSGPGGTALRAAFIGNASDPAVDTTIARLRERNVQVTVFSEMPPDPSMFETLIVHPTANVGPAYENGDADAFRELVARNEVGVVFIGRAPGRVASGDVEDENLANIALWFGAQRFEDDWRSGGIYVQAGTGPFPLPAGIRPNAELYDIFDNEVILVGSRDLTPLDNNRVLRYNEATNPNAAVAGFTFERSGSGRVYWQTNAIGINAAMTNRLTDFFVAGCRWAGRK